MELAGRVGDAFAERIRSLEAGSLGPNAVRSYETLGREREEEPCHVRTPFMAAETPRRVVPLRSTVRSVSPEREVQGAQFPDLSWVAASACGVLRGGRWGVGLPY